VISVEEALARVLALAPAEPEPRTVPLREASGRVLVRDAVAGLTQPPFPASAMDGYAIRDADHRPGAVLTLGGTSTRREKRHPTLEDHVTVGAGCGGTLMTIGAGTRSACCAL